MRYPAIAVIAGVLATGALEAAAQTPEPANDQPSAYRSAFAGYRPFKDQSVASWRDVNREVGQIGGHAGSLGRAGAPRATVPSAQPRAPDGAPSDKPSPVHAGHQ